MVTPADQPPELWWSPTTREVIEGADPDGYYVVRGYRRHGWFPGEHPADAVQLTPHQSVTEVAPGSSAYQLINELTAEKEALQAENQRLRADRDSLLAHRAQFRDLWEHDRHAEAIRHLGYEAPAALAQARDHTEDRHPQPADEDARRSRTWVGEKFAERLTVSLTDEHIALHVNAQPDATYGHGTPISGDQIWLTFDQAADLGTHMLALAAAGLLTTQTDEGEL